MKKLYIILLFLLAVPFTAHGSFSVPLVATSTTGWVFPSAVNGSYLPLFANNIIASSTTATSSFSAPFTFGPINTPNIEINTAGHIHVGIQNAKDLKTALTYPSITVSCGASTNGSDCINIGNTQDGWLKMEVDAVGSELCLSTGNDEKLACKDSWPSGGYTYGNGLVTMTYGTGAGDGNVGIGTSTPFSKLSVSNATGQVATTSLFAVASSTNATLFNVLANGNVGIGTTSPGTNLGVEGTSLLGNLAQAGRFIATTSTASIFPFASTTALTATNYSNTGTGNQRVESYASCIVAANVGKPCTIFKDTGGTGKGYIDVFTYSNETVPGTEWAFEDHGGFTTNQYFRNGAFSGSANPTLRDMAEFSGEQYNIIFGTSTCSNSCTSVFNPFFGVLTPSTSNLNRASAYHTNIFEFASSTAGGASYTDLLVGTASGLVGIATSSPWRTLSVTGTLAVSGLTAFATGDSAVCIRSTGEITSDSGVSSCIVSTKAAKHDIQKELSADAYARVMKLQPVVFEYNGTNKPDIGLIAEDVAAIDPRYAQYDPKTLKPKAINWAAITADMIAVIQADHGVYNSTTTPSTTPDLAWLGLLGLGGFAPLLRKKK